MSATEIKKTKPKPKKKGSTKRATSDAQVAASSEKPVVEAKPVVPAIYRALRGIQLEIAAIGKEGKNQGQGGFKFRRIDDMYDQIHPLLKKYGVVISPKAHTDAAQFSSHETKNRHGDTQRWFHAVVPTEFVFYSLEDGSGVSVGPVYGEGLDNSDKSVNKASSGSLKYALAEMFLIPFSGVIDSDETTPVVMGHDGGPEDQTPQEEIPPPRQTQTPKSQALPPKAEPKPEVVVEIHELLKGGRIDPNWFNSQVVGSATAQKKYPGVDNWENIPGEDLRLLVSKGWKRVVDKWVEELEIRRKALEG